jgi:hypothetical protein
MRKFFINLLIMTSLFLLTAILIGCRNDDEVNPDPVVLKSFLTAWATPESVAYNGSATVSWEAKNVTTLYFNGVKIYDLGNITSTVSKTGVIPVSGLVKDSVFEFTGMGADGNLLYPKSITVKVGPAPVVVLSTKRDTMKAWVYAKPWRIVDNETRKPDGTFISKKGLPEKYWTALTYYYSDGTGEMYWYPYGKEDLAANGKWDISEDCKTFMSGCPYKLIFLSVDSMVIAQPSAMIDAQSGENTPVDYYMHYVNSPFPK